MTGTCSNSTYFYFCSFFSLFTIELYALDAQEEILDPEKLAELMKGLTPTQKAALEEAGFILIYEVHLI